MTSSKKPEQSPLAPTSSSQKPKQKSESEDLFDDLSSFLEEGIKAIEESSGLSGLPGGKKPDTSAAKPKSPARTQTPALGSPKISPRGSSRPTGAKAPVQRKPLTTTSGSASRRPLGTGTAPKPAQKTTTATLDFAPPSTIVPKATQPSEAYPVKQEALAKTLPEPPKDLDETVKVSNEKANAAKEAAKEGTQPLPAPKATAAPKPTPAPKVASKAPASPKTSTKAPPLAPKVKSAPPVSKATAPKTPDSPKVETPSAPPQAKIASKAPEPAPKEAPTTPPAAQKSAEPPQKPVATPTPSAPKVAEAPKKTEAPKAATPPKTAKAIEPPKVPAPPKAAEAPKVAEASKAQEAPKVPAPPKAVKAPEPPEAKDAKAAQSAEEFARKELASAPTQIGLQAVPKGAKVVITPNKAAKAETKSPSKPNTQKPSSPPPQKTAKEAKTAEPAPAASAQAKVVEQAAKPPTAPAVAHAQAQPPSAPGRSGTGSVLVFVTFLLLIASNVWLFSRLQGLQDETATRFAPLQENVSLLEKTTQKRYSRMTSLELQVKELQDSLQKLQQKVKATRKKQLATNGTFRRLGTKHTNQLKRLEGREATHTKQLASFGLWRKQTNTKVVPGLRQQIGQNRSGIKANLAHFRKQFKGLDSRESLRFRAQQKRNTDFSKQLGALRLADQSTTKQLKGLASRATKGETHRAALQSSKEAHQAFLARLDKTLKPLPASVAILQKQDKQKGKQLKQLKLQSEARSWMFTRIVSEIKPVQQGIKTLNKHLEASNKRIKQLEDTATNHKLVISNVSSTLPSAMQLLKTLNSQFTSQQKQLDKLQNKVSSLSQ